MSELINVEVAYALPDKQLIKALEVPDSAGGYLRQGDQG